MKKLMQLEHSYMDLSLGKEEDIVLEVLLMEQMNLRCLIELRDPIKNPCNWVDLKKVLIIII